MQKTKLGISVPLLAAAVYFTALLGGFTPLVIVVGYILLCEENEWLRHNAIKAVVIYLLVALIPTALGFVDDVFGFFNVIIGWFGSFYLRWPGNIDSLVVIAVRLLGDLILLFSGIRALKMGGVPTPKVDSLINKHN